MSAAVPVRSDFGSRWRLGAAAGPCALLLASHTLGRAVGWLGCCALEHAGGPGAHGVGSCCCYQGSGNDRNGSVRRIPTVAVNVGIPPLTAWFSLFFSGVSAPLTLLFFCALLTVRRRRRNGKAPPCRLDRSSAPTHCFCDLFACSADRVVCQRTLQLTHRLCAC